jgi:glucose/arabinose dehydrogenase/cytochrome c5
MFTYYSNLKPRALVLRLVGIALIAMAFLIGIPSNAQATRFHSAPESAEQKNPYAGDRKAAEVGGQLYASNCAGCHALNAQGTGNVPALASGPTQSASGGEIFWYITMGDLNNGMPSWEKMPAEQRWRIVTFLKALGGPDAARLMLRAREADNQDDSTLPQPKEPFTGYRFEQPGKFRKITLADLPAPYVTNSAANAPQVVPRPPDAWPKAPVGFTVEQYAQGLDNPRLIRTAPNGDFFLAESSTGKIRILRGLNADHKAAQNEVFAAGLNRPFGIAFYPPGPNPQWVYVANTNSVVRFPYRNGDLKATGPAQHLADLPSGSGHWTRDVRFSPDWKTMFVSVGSGSNVDDPDTIPAEKNRADILAFNIDGSGMRIYASGIRNPVGLAIDPDTGEPWCSVNERDGLGDNLVPDYITHVTPGGFYGWPWWYMGGHQDPRHAGKHPELKQKVITPDVILQPHNASLEMTFYEGKQFPPEYRGDVFASEHGSWNKSVRAGYEVIRVPLHQTGHATGEYEDFLTGFVVNNRAVWGRPVGVTVAHDGSLLVTDDGSNSVWRVSYTGSAVSGGMPSSQ